MYVGRQMRSAETTMRKVIESCVPRWTRLFCIYEHGFRYRYRGGLIVLYCAMVEAIRIGWCYFVDLFKLDALDRPRTGEFQLDLPGQRSPRCAPTGTGHHSISST